MKNTKFYIALKKTYERLLKIRGHPREISLGFALGIFIGMTPTMGFQIAIAVPIASLLKWNKISAAIGVWISNPITAPLLYSFTYTVGAYLLGWSEDQNVAAMIAWLSKIPGILWESVFGNVSDTSVWETVRSILSKTSLFLWASTIGGVIVGIPSAALAYYFSFSAITRYQEDIKRKLAEQKAKRAKKKAEKKQRKSKKKKKKKKKK